MSEDGEPRVRLRPVHASDLDALFRQMSDPESVRMAAFTAEDPADRQRFDAHVAKILATRENTMLVVTWGEDVVGSIGSFLADGRTEVTYWIDRAFWGRGIATRALALHLEEVETRPVYAAAASDNVASLRVLEKNGFRPIGTDVAFAPARGGEIEETILRLG
jgi:RimJ/RimL family protein N-acetyltransferase